MGSLKAVWKIYCKFVNYKQEHNGRSIPFF